MELRYGGFGKMEKIEAKKYLDKKSCGKVPLIIHGLLYELVRNQNELIERDEIRNQQIVILLDKIISMDTITFEPKKQNCFHCKHYLFSKRNKYKKHICKLSYSMNTLDYCREFEAKQKKLLTKEDIQKLLN